MEYTAVIIDDEKMARTLLDNMLKTHCPQVRVLDQCADLAEGVKSIIKNKPNLVFLDIEMPGHTGLELLDFFDENDVDFSIIFTTAYNHYAIQAFKLSAIDYLLKPIVAEDLENAVERFAKNKDKANYSALKTNLNGKQPSRIGLPTSNSIKFVELDQILFIKADGAYTHVHLKNETCITVCKTLKYYEDVLHFNNTFFRCHKSFIVNLHYITDWVKSEGGYLIINNQHQISLSSDKTNELIQLLNLAKK